ncbi:MAG: histidine kinase dimerization/phospho-acceptor domain-containing protein [Thermodesulfovibrionales bacterium]
MAIFDGITDFIFVSDDKYNIVKINQALASYFKKTPRELIGKKCYELFKCDLDACQARTLSSGPSRTYETTIDDRIYQVTLYHLLDRIPLIIHYMKDITELIRFKNQLYHAEKLTSLGLLVSGVAHEINNPLTGVIAYTELLLMKTGDEKVKNELKKILQSAERCKRIVENLLTFSRQREPVKSLESINSIIEKQHNRKGNRPEGILAQIKQYRGNKGLWRDTEPPCGCPADAAGHSEHSSQCRTGNHGS